MSEEKTTKRKIDSTTVFLAGAFSLALITLIAVGVWSATSSEEAANPDTVPTLEIPQQPNGDFAPDRPKPLGTTICSSSPSGLKEILEAPKVVWVPVDYGFYPSNAAIGPGVITDDGLAQCWAPTTEGAVAAAYNYLYANAKRPDLYNVVDKLAYHDAYVKEQLKTPQQPRQPYGMLIHSFKTQVLDDTHIVVSLILEVGSGGKVTTAVPLVWDGDWKVQILPVQGGFPISPTTVSEEHNFIPFTPGS